MVSASLVINDTSFVTFPQISSVSINGVTTNAWYFDGNSRVESNPKEALTLELSSFTIEFWVNPDESGGRDQIIYSNYATMTNEEFNYFMIILASSNNKIALFDPTSNPRLFDDRDIPNNTWTHCAIVRYEDSTTKIFINGFGVDRNIMNYNFNRTDYIPVIGAPYTTSSTTFTNYALKGYLANLKITKGSALYTTDFIPTVIVETPNIP
jgi:hypothetical protein